MEVEIRVPMAVPMAPIESHEGRGPYYGLSITISKGGIISGCPREEGGDG